ncbi:MAG: HemK/PrmC family methyltransferase [Candidatus Saccharibacteria bacterium]|nr:HemK/PrmC family methyltransferase [Candidatus Saccharibacteria bacterium]
MSENYPKAYKKGFQDFYGYNFKVTEDVLIPRPETEQIVDAVLDLAGVSYLPGVKPKENQIGDHPKILDVGTGSGCIAITLSLKLKNAEIVATDLSEKALEIAKENYQNLTFHPKNHTPAFHPCQKNHTPTVKFLTADLLEGINFIPDLITANLPYVDESWDWLDKSALSHEPSEALYAKDHGLELIKKLIDQASRREVKYLILEADSCQHQTIAEYSKIKNYELLETRGFILCMRLVQH